MKTVQDYILYDKIITGTEEERIEALEELIERYTQAKERASYTTSEGICSHCNTYDALSICAQCYVDLEMELEGKK